MTRLRQLYFILVFILVVTGGNAAAQSALSASATGHITAEVITALAAVETAEMNFGRFSPGPQGGELILTPESTVSVLGTVYPGTGTHNAASFYVTGEAAAAYSISLPATPVIITHIAGAKTMTVEEWRSIPEATPGSGMLEGGFQTVYVGATLKVGILNDNPVGLYKGTYTITFDFN